MKEISTIENGRNDGSPVVVKNKGEATEQILRDFLHFQEENYSDLDYHNEQHPDFVRKKALEFAKVIMHVDPALVTKDTLADIVNSAAAHDAVLNVARGEQIMRFRGFYESDFTGEAKRTLREKMKEQGITKGNELLSAEWLERERDRYVDAEGKPVFGEKSREEVWLVMAATVPEFDFTATIPDDDYRRYFREGRLAGVDLERYRTGVKIWQPHLGPESSVVALAVGGADLRGAAASENPEDIRRSGDAEFREVFLWIREALGRGVESILPEQRIKIADSILRWIKSQVTFIMWQKVLFWHAIDENHAVERSPKAAEIKRALAERYNDKFDLNILNAKERYERLEKKNGVTDDAEGRRKALTAMGGETLKELLREVGYQA